MDKPDGDPGAILGGSSDAYPASPERVARIVSRAHRRVGVRDLITFSFVRMWGTLLGIGVVLYGLVAGATDHSAGARRVRIRREDTGGLTK